MRLDPEERILLTDDQLKRMDDISKEHHELTTYMKSAITRYKERNENESQ